LTAQIASKRLAEGEQALPSRLLYCFMMMLTVKWLLLMYYWIQCVHMILYASA